MLSVAALAGDLPTSRSVAGRSRIDREPTKLIKWQTYNLAC